MRRSICDVQYATFQVHGSRFKVERAAFAVCLALLLPILAWASYARAEGESQTTVPEITIGVVGPMSGDLAHMGRYVRDAVALAVEEWNEKGGILGRRIQLLAEDDRNDPAEAVAAAKRLVQAGVWGVIGHLTTAGSLPASAIYHAAGIPQITPSSTDPRLTEQGFMSLFRTCGRDDQQGRVAAEFVLHSLHPRRLVILHDQTAYGQALAAAFERRMMHKPRSLSVTSMVISSGGKDIGSVIERIKPKEPDLVYFGGLYHEGGLLAKRLREQGIKATLVSGDGVIGTEFIDLAGEGAATGTYLTFAPDPMLLPSAEAAIKRFHHRYGAIGPYTLYAYDAAGALFTAIARAKPKAASRSHLLRVSQSLHRMTYLGALGELRWDAKGDRIKPPYVIYQVKKGGSFQGWFEQVTDRTPKH
ncbi:MAG: branched-chain amino acid ABC transporter substrate-binding protein [Candidatus Methylomirabilis oxyfera]|nr:branched-chain amino acid ABC transporter substrate-binding protein [Candidatus Methylomirabilis oxyfera]